MHYRQLSRTGIPLRHSQILTRMNLERKESEKRRNMSRRRRYVGGVTAARTSFQSDSPYVVKSGQNLTGL